MRDSATLEIGATGRWTLLSSGLGMSPRRPTRDLPRWRSPRVGILVGLWDGREERPTRDSWISRDGSWNATCRFGTSKEPSLLSVLTASSPSRLDCGSCCPAGCIGCPGSRVNLSPPSAFSLPSRCVRSSSSSFSYRSTSACRRSASRAR